MDAVSVKNVNSISDFSGEIKITNLATAARMTSKGTNIKLKKAQQTLGDLGLA